MIHITFCFFSASYCMLVGVAVGLFGAYQIYNLKETWGAKAHFDTVHNRIGMGDR
eukprot:UN03368